MGAIAVGGRVRGGRRSRRARAVRPSKKIEMAVRRQLLANATLLQDDVDAIEELLLTGDVATINRVLRDMQEKWRSVYGNKSDAFATKWLAAVSAENKKRFQDSLKRALGVDYTAIFDDKVVYAAAEASAFEASRLITNLPEEYFSEIQRAVMTNFQQLPLPEGRSLLEHIHQLNKNLEGRAYLIARDQTSKINTAITQARNEEIGIEEYIWRTAGDSRVVGTPGGLFPSGNKVHGNHYVRNGETFRWDSPPPDGHPGYAINCRCVAEPKIDIEKLKFV